MRIGRGGVFAIGVALLVVLVARGLGAPNGEERPVQKPGVGEVLDGLMRSYREMLSPREDPVVRSLGLVSLPLVMSTVMSMITWMRPWCGYTIQRELAPLRQAVVDELRQFGSMTP